MPSHGPSRGTARLRAALCGLLLSAAVAPAPAHAVDVALGLGAGVAIPFGQIAGSPQSAALSDELSLAFPVQLDVGLSLTPGLLLGVYGQYAPAKLTGRAPLGTSACTGFGASCSGASYRRFGVELEYHPIATRGHWIGAAAGFGWVGYDFHDTGGAGSLSYRGLEVSLQGGSDFVIAAGWTLGPVAGITAGRFDRASVSQAGSSLGGTIAEKRFHGWLTLGARLRVGL